MLLEMEAEPDERLGSWGLLQPLGSYALEAAQLGGGVLDERLDTSATLDETLDSWGDERQEPHDSESRRRH